MGLGCEALALRTISSTDEGLDPKGAFMGLGANYWISSCCYAYAISEALQLRGFGPLGRPGNAKMTGPLQGLDAALRGLAGSTDESLDPKLGLTMQRYFGCFVAKINGVGTYNLRGA